MKKEALGFLSVGAVAAIVDFLFYMALWNFFGASLEVSKGASFAAGTFFAYFANRDWTFRHLIPDGRSWPRFVILYGVSLVLNVSVNSLLVELLSAYRFKVEVGFFVATATSAALNFIGMKFWVSIPKKQRGSK